MAFSIRSSARDPDQAALRQTGDMVRARLDAEPAAYRLPVEGLDIYAIADFLSAAERDRMTAIIDAVARPSSTYSNSRENVRTSYSGDVDPREPFIRMIQRRIDDVLGIAPELGETMQGQRYQVGQEFRHHHDYFISKHAYWEDECKRGGQRSWTAMIYLNTVEEGGATDFPHVNLSIPPQSGVLVTWNNMARDGRPNTLSLHAGAPVIRGTKYVLTKWYRARPWS